MTDFQMNFDQYKIDFYLKKKEAIRRQNEPFYGSKHGRVIVIGVLNFSSLCTMCCAFLRLVLVKTEAFDLMVVVVLSTSTTNSDAYIFGDNLNGREL